MIMDNFTFIIKIQPHRDDLLLVVFVISILADYLEKGVVVVDSTDGGLFPLVASC